MTEYLSIVSQVLFCAALTIFFVALFVVSAYYSFVLAHTFIEKRCHYFNRIKKSKSFKVFNSPKAKAGLSTSKKEEKRK